MVKYCFAFGSNMSLTQMNKRCPESSKLCIATLENHKLSFPRFSNTRKCGVASVETKEGEIVWGVVFRLTGSDWSKLDKYEGVKRNFYKRVGATVYENGDSNKPIECETYVAIPEGEFFPNKDYLSTILEGAKENHLPNNYIESLIATRTQPQE
jgi:gamma-glutamylcyclotransferase